MRDPYWRRARLVRIIDGDTVQVIVDLGYYTYAEHRMRLLGVDTPEMNDRDPDVRARAVAATQYTTGWFVSHAPHGDDAGWPFRIRSQKADSFGRFLALVECGEGHSLNEMLLETGHGRPYP
jgi:micrococcal nuclease